MTSPDPTIVAALSDLWRIPRPGPDKLFSSPRFVALRDLCAERFGGGKAPFALSTALRGMGFPCQLPKGKEHLTLDVETAAMTLERAFRQQTAVRRHLCPLDLADDLPSIRFGPARVEKFSAGELEKLFDAPRLARIYPNVPFEASRFAQFHWLVVEEEIQLEPRAEARAAPFLFDLGRDFGAIEPHLGRFPPTVESALFYLLLAPWEDWSTMADLDWRGFRVPWIYTLDDDLFVYPKRPPSPDDLTLEPDIFEDQWGNEVENERPTTYRLEDVAATQLAGYPPSAWADLEAARAATVFETPVVHFLVRAFLAEGIDEFMAHMTTIEAALGVELDHRRKLRPKGRATSEPVGDPARGGPAGRRAQRCWLRRRLSGPVRAAQRLHSRPRGAASYSLLAAEPGAQPCTSRSRSARATRCATCAPACRYPRRPARPRRPNALTCAAPALRVPLISIGLAVRTDGPLFAVVHLKRRLAAIGPNPAVG